VQPQKEVKSNSLAKSEDAEEEWEEEVVEKALCFLTKKE